MEISLRQLATLVLGAKFGPDWITKIGLKPSTVAILSERRDVEVQRRAPARVDQDLVAYLYLSELRWIVCQHSREFAPILGKKAHYEPFLLRLEGLRNAPCHGRTLLRHERALVEGIAGDIRNRVTIYRSSMDETQKHYPVIESVVDSFGNKIEGGEAPVLWRQVHTDLVLAVGEKVHFECRGRDAQDRELIWTLSRGRSPALDFTPVVGNAVTLTWTVSRDDVGTSAYAFIDLRSDGEFHAHQRYDDRVAFRYRVDPPTA